MAPHILGHTCGLEQTAGGILLFAQPESASGSPDVIVSRGKRAGAKASARWIRDLGDAVDGWVTGKTIRKALDRARERLDLDPFSHAVEDAALHAAMLGAIDAKTEELIDEAVAPAAFSAHYWEARQSPILLAKIDSGERLANFANRGIEDAIQAFRNRAILSEKLLGVMGAKAKRDGFSIARQATRRMLLEAKRELNRQIAQGSDLRTFRKFMARRLEAAGWTPASSSHVETIFRTNIMGAYNKGRRTQQTQPMTAKARPFWQWVAVADSRSRPAHAAANGKVLLSSDPFWKRAYPPSGFQCRCRVVSRSARNVGVITKGSAMPSPLPDPGFRAGF